MELVNFEDLMRAKLVECNEWLNGYDEAVARCVDCEKAYEDAKVAYEKAKADVADYNDDNIKRVADYKANLEDRLGIVRESVENDVAVCGQEEVVVPPVFGIVG